MKTLSGFCAALLFFLPVASRAQVNSGSNGSDGAFTPSANRVINMANRPDGIYHYTSVNIPAGVTISFIPNAGNSPVVWLVQGDCVINGTVNISGKPANAGVGGIGGPGGWGGGSGGDETNPASSGLGPGGGAPGGYTGDPPIYFGGNGSYGTKGNQVILFGQQKAAGVTYGNVFLLPLLGGSGGGGSAGSTSGGGGGGGAMLISSSKSIVLDGFIDARGGGGPQSYSSVLGDGSGGGVRLVASILTGNGHVDTSGGITSYAFNSTSEGGKGRVRFDAFQNSFGGIVRGAFTQGFQPIILPAAGQGIQVSIASIAGYAISSNPSGVLVNPDVIIPAQQANPIPIVINCNNIPLNSEISVIVRPANGAEVQAVTRNNAGTLAASTATVSLNMPRGGGIIYAKCVSGLAGLGADTSSKELRTRSLAETGWTADGERFAKMEITAALGGQQQITYITESGKRHTLAAR